MPNYLQWKFSLVDTAWEAILENDVCCEWKISLLRSHFLVTFINKI